MFATVCVCVCVIVCTLQAQAGGGCCCHDSSSAVCLRPCRGWVGCPVLIPITSASWVKHDGIRVVNCPRICCFFLIFLNPFLFLFAFSSLGLLSALRTDPCLFVPHWNMFLFLQNLQETRPTDPTPPDLWFHRWCSLITLERTFSETHRPRSCYFKKKHFSISHLKVSHHLQTLGEMMREKICVLLVVVSSARFDVTVTTEL